jgi:hypothetical protein
MYLDKEINELLNMLKSSTALKEISFIKACPYAKKPTRLLKKVCTLSPAELDLESISVDDENFYGKYAVDVDLFVPYELGSPVAFDDMEEIVRCVMNEKVCAIKLSSIVRDSTAECYKITATFTFSLAYSKEA